MQQVVGRLQAADDAELFGQQASDVFAAQRADAIVDGGSAADALLKLSLLLGRESFGTTAARLILQAGKTLRVVAGDPGPDRPFAELDPQRQSGGRFPFDAPSTAWRRRTTLARDSERTSRRSSAAV